MSNYMSSLNNFQGGGCINDVIVPSRDANQTGTETKDTCFYE